MQGTLNFLHPCLQGIGVQTLQRTAKAQQLLHLGVGQVHVIAGSNLTDLRPNLIVAHGLGHVQHQLQLVDDGSGVHGADLGGQLSGDGQLLGADQLGQVIQFFAGHVLIGLIHAAEGRGTADLKGGGHNNAGVGDAGSSQGADVHFAGAPVDVAGGDGHAAARRQQLHIDAGDGAGADEAVIHIAFQIGALLGVGHFQLDGVAPPDAEHAIDGFHLFIAQVRADDRAALVHIGIGRNCHAGHKQQGQQQGKYFFHCVSPFRIQAERGRTPAAPGLYKTSAGLFCSPAWYHVRDKK